MASDTTTKSKRSHSGTPAQRLLGNYWFYAILLVLIIAGYSLLQTAERYHIEQGTPLAENVPRLLMYKVKSEQYNAKGQIERRITADGLAQFIDNQISISNPLITLYKEGQPQLYLSGQRADMQGAIVKFNSKVTISTTTATPILLTGDSLEYNQQQQTVHVINPGITLTDSEFSSTSTAATLIADVRAETLQLNNRVTTRITLPAQ